MRQKLRKIARERRLQLLKERILSGNYQVDAETLAKALLLVPYA